LRGAIHAIREERGLECKYDMDAYIEPGDRLVDQEA
jgi:hypothetical protein